jgi:uncharacterized protein with FMN-binding domain
MAARMRLLIVGLALAIALGAGPVTTAPSRTPATQPAKVTRADIQKKIADAGKTPPDWWDSVTPTYPQSLQLDCSDPNPPGWNNQKNIGQFLWDIINPNPHRWKEGAKLVHQTLPLVKDDKVKLNKAMGGLAHIYFDLLQDYPRAAFWSQKVGNNPLMLANCYWKMGSREMAVEILQRYGQDNTRNGEVIKLWSDMGDLQRALQLADQKAKNHWADVAYLAAGDAYRRVGKYNEAIASYEKVAAVNRKGADIAMNKGRALANITAIKLFEGLDLSRIADGAYKDSSLGYNGPVEVTVKVTNGKIESVDVTNHQEKQFYASFTDTAGQIIQKQHVKGIDATSGATVTSEAIINATAKALSGGMK